MLHMLFDLADRAKNPKENCVKDRTTIELMKYVSSVNGEFTETVVQEIINILSVNFFPTVVHASPPPRRPREAKIKKKPAASPPPRRPREAKIKKKPAASPPPRRPSEAKTKNNPAPKKRQSRSKAVYELILRLLGSPKKKAPMFAERYIDQSFVLRLLDQFDSMYPQERRYLKAILLRVYVKFIVRRKFIRKSINDVLCGFIYETEKHSGIADLLVVVGRLITSFALPLEEEHRHFLVRVLIPLHKPKCMPMYHQQLSHCITKFVEKDCTLADAVIRGLLKYWPKTNTSKEVVFLGELAKVLEATRDPEFQRCMVPLFRQISRCFSSSHFQVAKGALLLCKNNHTESLIKKNLKVILPLILPSLEKNARNHWNQKVKTLALDVRKLFSAADFERFELKFQEEESKEEEMRSKRDAVWKCLEEYAAMKAITLPPPSASARRWVSAGFPYFGIPCVSQTAIFICVCFLFLGVCFLYVTLGFVY